MSQAAEIARYSLRLADRIRDRMDAGEFPLVLGGDCSIVLGSARHAPARRGPRRPVGSGIRGRTIDFAIRASLRVGARRGEALALVTGGGQPDLAATSSAAVRA